jgi:TRAP-type C4-dicarboxylate transport system permease small subunit
MVKYIRWLDQAAMLIAVTAVAMIMILVSLDATFRYAFNAPIRWSFELVRYYLMVVVIYFAVTETFTRGDHVNITLFRDMMPKRVVAWIDIAWCLLAAVIFSFVVYATWGNVTYAWEHREFIPGYFLWPSWLSHLPIPLACGLLVLRLIRHCIVLATDGTDFDINDNGDPTE